MSTAVSSASPLERFAYDDKIVRNFIVATLVWGVVGMVVGILVALQLAWPAANFDISWLTFGRLRPLHTNAVIFAFAGNAIFAGIYHSSQRLLKARMLSDRLSQFHFWSWQLIIVAAAITLPLGLSTSKEYAELEFPIKIAIAVSWIAFGINLFGTILKRRERHIYVAIWFYIATWVGITMLHVVNSLSIPVTVFKSYSMFAGIQDALVQWWYGHNAVAFFLTTPFLGLMYYYLPKAANRPVYSYRLSIVHFWGLIFLYIWAGPHHLLNTATPEWAQTLGVVFSIMLLAPSWGGMINGLLTLRGAFDKVRTDPVLKFLVGAVTFYGMATFEGPLLSLREVNALSHNTDWTIGHAHSGALGWNGLLAFGMIYWLVPRLWKTKLYSDGLANLHFWLATAGIALYAVSLWIAGIATGMMQLQFTETGHLKYQDWIEIVNTMKPYYWIRIGAGLLYLAGTAIGVYVVWKTIRASGNKLVDEAVAVPALAADEPVKPLIDSALAQPTPRARLSAIHGLLERWPVVFIALTAVALAVGGICEIIPSLVQGALSPKIATVKPYTPLELTGRDIYIREGCVSCHTQMVRTLRAETERYGADYKIPGTDAVVNGRQFTRPGEHIYDRPFLWGSKRTGPDLQRTGVIRQGATAWLYEHIVQARVQIPGTIMPNYPWLKTDDMDLSTLSRKLEVLAMLPPYGPDGYFYSKSDIANAEALARAQAKEVAADLIAKRPATATEVPDLERKEVIAMLAYLQRLGTDFMKSLPAKAAAAPAAPTTPVAPSTPAPAAAATGG